MCRQNMQYSFVVDGDPKGQPRARAARVGKFVRMYTPATAADFKDRIRAAATAAGLRGKMLQGPLKLEMTARFARPKSHFRSNGDLKPTAPKWHTGKPDYDNVAKCQDALTSIGAWRDDSQIAVGYIHKEYSNTFPHTEFKISCLS